METYNIFLVNNGKLTINFHNLSDDFLTNKKFKTFDSCFIDDYFSIINLDFNFFIFFTHRFILDPWLEPSFLNVSS